MLLESAELLPAVDIQEHQPRAWRPWPAEKIDALKVLFSEQKRLVDIASELGMSEHYVKWKIKHLGLTRLRPDHWTDDNIALLRAMWADGSSAQTISDVIGTTRNAVLGKVHRLRLPTRADNKPERAAVWSGRRRTKQASKAKPIRISKPHLVQAPIFRESCATFDAKIPRERLKPLVDLQANDCRWPIGDPGDPGFGFCCARTDGVHSYCSDHRAFSIERGRRKTTWVDRPGTPAFGRTYRG